MKSLTLPKGTIVIVLASGLSLALTAETEVAPDREISADQIAEHFVASGRPDLVSLLEHTEEKEVIDPETKQPKKVTVNVVYGTNADRFESIVEEVDTRTPEEKFRDDVGLRTVAVLKKIVEALGKELPREVNRKDEILAFIFGEANPKQIAEKLAEIEKPQDAA